MIDSIIFDFDYTLGDSSPGIIESANYALARLGLPLATPAAIRRTIGLSLPETLKALAGPDHANPHADLGQAFQDYFVERADEVMADSTRLFESVPDTVRELSARGLNLGIVSSKYRRRIEGLLEREGLRDLFGVIVGGEDVSAFKPDPGGLIFAVRMLSSNPTSALYVGDSLVDAETAKRASVPFVAVLSGVTGRHEFSDYTVHHVLHSVSELPAILPDVL